MLPRPAPSSSPALKTNSAHNGRTQPLQNALRSYAPTLSMDLTPACVATPSPKLQHGRSYPCLDDGNMTCYRSSQPIVQPPMSSNVENGQSVLGPRPLASVLNSLTSIQARGARLPTQISVICPCPWSSVVGPRLDQSVMVLERGAFERQPSSTRPAGFLTLRERSDSNEASRRYLYHDPKNSTSEEPHTHGKKRVKCE